MLNLNSSSSPACVWSKIFCTTCFLHQWRLFVSTNQAACFLASLCELTTSTDGDSYFVRKKRWWWWYPVWEENKCAEGRGERGREGGEVRTPFISPSRLQRRRRRRFDSISTARKQVEEDDNWIHAPILNVYVNMLDFNLRWSICKQTSVSDSFL